jgi:murein DD-endopeptidase MepM/ murein hydrolase activator NlpD
MSSKADNTSYNLDRSRSRIFFRNPLLLKIVAWLGSLSFIGNTSVVWADIQPIANTSRTDVQALIQTSEATDINDILQSREIFGSDRPNNSKEDWLQQQATSQPASDRSVPVGIVPGASVSPTGKITVPQSVKGLGSKRIDGEIAVDIPVPVPRSMKMPPNGDLVAKMRSQAQGRMRDSIPKTGIEVSANHRTTAARIPTPNASLPRDTKRAIATTIVTPMRPSLVGKRSLTPMTRSPQTPVPQQGRIEKVKPIPQLPEVGSGKIVPTVPPLPAVNNNRANLSQSKPLAFVAKPSAALEGVQLIYPLTTPAPITSAFGWRTHPITGSRRFHAGVDIGAPMGAPVVAAGSGTVVVAGWVNGYGKAITIQHNGVQQTLYGHLSEISVQPGQTIEKGTVIGRVGSTGNSTGPHLHFESRMSTSDGWVAVDPGDDVKYALSNLRREIDLARKDLSQRVN